MRSKTSGRAPSASMGPSPTTLAMCGLSSRAALGSTSKWMAGSSWRTKAIFPVMVVQQRQRCGRTVPPLPHTPRASSRACTRFSSSASATKNTIKECATFSSSLRLAASISSASSNIRSSSLRTTVITASSCSPRRFCTSASASVSTRFVRGRSRVPLPGSAAAGAAPAAPAAPAAAAAPVASASRYCPKHAASITANTMSPASCQP
mmetsp:Transcript_39896/g.124780  ORF Transcript_39896/g.124780 Transcript_39896/m.124780 type:complete len:207 (+) Transcript_39896:220-840(+)